jgi:hypothetical protein
VFDLAAPPAPIRRQFAIVLFSESVGFDEGLMITICCPDRRKYQQITFRQTPTVQQWRHLCRSGVIKTACCTKQMEDTMSKLQMKSNKEAKKPKADQDHSKKHGPSDYQRSLGKEAPTDDPFKKKS